MEAVSERSMESSKIPAGQARLEEAGSSDVIEEEEFSSPSESDRGLLRAIQCQESPARMGQLSFGEDISLEQVIRKNKKGRNKAGNQVRLVYVPLLHHKPQPGLVPAVEPKQGDVVRERKVGQGVESAGSASSDSDGEVKARVPNREVVAVKQAVGRSLWQGGVAKRQLRSVTLLRGGRVAK